MGDNCIVKTELEKSCHAPCKTAWHHYEECAHRLEGLDALTTPKLVELAKKHDLNTKDLATNKELPRDDILGNIKAVASCTHQYFHYWACVDNCVAPKLWRKLK